MQKDSQNTDFSNVVVEMAIEGWRFSRLFIRVAKRLDAGEAEKYISQLRYFLKKNEDSLQALGLKLVNLEGMPYDAGMPVSAINIDEFGPDDQLYVEQMIEPVIMGKDGLRRPGTVMLKKVVK
jgi:hypothetical protein